MDIKSIIAKSKQKKFLEEGGPMVRDFVNFKVTEMVQETLEKMLPDITSMYEKMLIEQIQKLTKDIKKGDPGDKPVVGIDYELPEDGEDYVLTEIDKQEIASMIKVPIVKKVVEKKTEIIKQPIVTQEVKEVAKYETADQIAEKLNTLEEKIDVKAVRGLNAWMQSLKSMVTGKVSGGGGMGNVQHEHFDTSSATTLLTLTQNIAGGGFALWAYYNGQMIARGVGYSVTGRIVTPLFTPDDGSTFDFIYIRT